MSVPLIKDSISFRLCVVQVPGGFCSECWLEGELIGRRATFPTMEEAIADTEVARNDIIADLAARGIVASEHPRAQA